ncbi:hypothetical protein [Delftia sp.]|uniref:hypothetical protein n=1 Tax=Delftia sp. TaxID=1886637 RepID=UPI00259CED61|nr:hypothetical protein [Delftia sp.]
MRKGDLALDRVKFLHHGIGLMGRGLGGAFGVHAFHHVLALLGIHVLHVHALHSLHIHAVLHALALHLHAAHVTGLSEGDGGERQGCDQRCG